MKAGDLLNTLVGDVLAACPAAARVFVDRGMACPGCPFASFETVNEVALAYGTDGEELAAVLHEVHGIIEDFES